eukprot:3441720-Rhodomonas_salina.1
MLSPSLPLRLRPLAALEPVKKVVWLELISTGQSIPVPDNLPKYRRICHIAGSVPDNLYQDRTLRSRQLSAHVAAALSVPDTAQQEYVCQGRTECSGYIGTVLCSIVYVNTGHRIANA